jgi:hypothetical protein
VDLRDRRRDRAAGSGHGRGYPAGRGPTGQHLCRTLRTEPSLLLRLGLPTIFRRPAVSGRACAAQTTGRERFCRISYSGAQGVPPVGAFPRGEPFDDTDVDTRLMSLFPLRAAATRGGVRHHVGDIPGWARGLERSHPNPGDVGVGETFSQYVPDSACAVSCIILPSDMRRSSRRYPPSAAHGRCDAPEAASYP